MLHQLRHLHHYLQVHALTVFFVAAAVALVCLAYLALNYDRSQAD